MTKTLRVYTPGSRPGQFTRYADVEEAAFEAASEAGFYVEVEYRKAVTCDHWRVTARGCDGLSIITGDGEDRLRELVDALGYYRKVS